MAVSVSDLQTRLAYRLGEDSTPSDSNEQARRLSYFNEANRKALGEDYWWFLQTTASTTSVANQEIYTLPTDFRDVIELRLDKKVCTWMPQSEAFGTYNYPPIYYQYDSVTQRFYIQGENELHLIPIPSDAPDAVSVSSITQSSGVATVTTATAHGYENHDYVTIAGADQSDYNGANRITSVPSTTTFTYTVDSSATSPATGTITVTGRNIVYRYWKYFTELTSSTTSIDIPDQFADILVAYAYGRKMGNVEGLRGSAQDGFEEYNQILKDMIRENNRRKFEFKGANSPYPADIPE